MEGRAYSETDPALIERVGDWADFRAWLAFDRTYRPMIRSWCGRRGLGPDDADELAQVVLIEAANRLRTFRYDPSQSFRGWLWKIARSRAVDLARSGRKKLHPLEAGDAEHLEWVDRSAEEDPSSDAVAERIRTLTAEVQQAVRGRIGPTSWQVFWEVNIEGRPVAEVADEYGKSYAAAYRGQRRVARMLQAEARERLRRGPAGVS